jgi:hypothetical protein
VRSLKNSEPALALHRTRQYYKKTTPGDPKGELRYSFLELVELFYYTRSSWPRDKMFALLNLAYDTTIGEAGFLPDYKSDEAVILSRYAEAFVKAGKALDLMYRAGTCKGSRFCSWIPDLMNERGEERYASTLSTWDACGREESGEPGFCAGEWCRAEVSVLAPEQSGLSTSVGSKRVPVLGVTGRVFDSIKTCEYLKLGLGGRSIRFIETMDIIRRNVSPLHIYPVDIGPDWRGELIVKCLIGDAAGPQTETSPLSAIIGNPQNQEKATTPWSAGFERHVLDVQPGQDAREYVNRPADARRVINQFWETASNFLQRIPNAAVCTTETRYAGIIPGEAAPGDKIFLPRGSKVPFVVRPFNDTSTGNTHYKLIGECYVHGIMYCENNVKKPGDTVVRLV